jgi:hypothetical protein
LTIETIEFSKTCFASFINGAEMEQPMGGGWRRSRNRTDPVDGFFTAKHYLIHDRDPLYTKDFLAIIADCAIEARRPRRRIGNDGAEL